MDDKFTCKLCKTVCTKKNDIKLSKEAFKHHMSLPHKYTCKACNMKFTSSGKLEVHSLSHIKKDVKSSSNECAICGNRFSDNKRLQEHKKEPHTYACKDIKCKRKFASEAHLEKHLQRKHKEFAAAFLKNGKIVFRCKLCLLNFDSSLELETHQNIPHNYSCHVCDQRFIGKNLLIEHLKKAHKLEKIPDQGFSCKLCKYTTMKMSEIRKHNSLRHSFCCRNCSSKFPCKDNLEVHIQEDHKNSSVEDFTEEVAPPEDVVSRLGVVVLLWAGSPEVRDHLHEVMSGSMRSTRHSLFMNRQEREECCRSQDSNLYQMSHQRFLQLPTAA